MLTGVDYPAGINNVEWDAVEPQPVHGKLVLSSRNVAGYGGALETSEPMPDHYRKAVGCTKYEAASATLLHGFVDIELHHRYQPVAMKA